MMRVEKAQMVSDIGETMKNSDFLFLITYKGLDVAQFSDFRNRLAEQNADCCVLKNRLILKAAELNGLDDIAKMELQGDTALVSGKGDPGIVAKTIAAFGKEAEAVAPKSGYLDGALLSGDDVKVIADLPSREVLLSQLIGVIQAPAREFVTVLNAKATEILNLLNAYKNKLEEN
ncbi:MAG: 50S ribosomal protein L10 [Kiritimatiellaeota bacterium]|nr:50S ribosomal protein L10 [Kiritimatiellota bacterium]